MKFIQNNTYHNPTLQFSITKPDGWVFMPSAWALHLKEQSYEHTPEFAEMVKAADLPFVHFYRYHEDAGYPCPTVQCGCRWDEGYSLEEQLAEITETLATYLPGARILNSTADYILSGHRSMYLEFTFFVNLNSGNRLHCLGRSLVVLRREHVFTIGLTGSVDAKYRCEDEFAEILRTLEIGR